MEDWLIPILIAPFIGSFLGVLIRRLPAGQPVAFARSRCESCNRTLRVADLIPLGSYLANLRRCRYCGAAIDIFHPAIELAALAVAIWAASLDGGFHLWADCVLGWTLLALAWIDTRHMVLPDALTLPLILAGFGVAIIETPDEIANHAAAAAIGWALFWGVARAYRTVRGRDGLGEGDAKLLAAAGAWIGLSGLGVVLLLAAVIALAIALAMRLRGAAMHAGTSIPFGSPLAMAIWLIWLYGPSLG